MPLSPVLLLHSFLFTFTLWLGLYLIRRDGQKMVLRLAGLGLLGYTLILVGELVWRPLAERANFLPALLWLGATLHLLPEETHGRERLWRVWRWGALPTAALLLALPSLTVGLIPLLLGCVLGLAILSRRSPFPHTVATLATVTLFFALSMGALLWPWAWFGQGWTLVLLGTDLAGLGLLIGVWDAFDEEKRSGRTWCARPWPPCFTRARWGAGSHSGRARWPIQPWQPMAPPRRPQFWRGQPDICRAVGAAV
ncbi:MAG: hypothetical protein IPL28_09950 [Chloroflexi bacterium]|nr:hypothetical protein [Chloroflexota bacterium]